MMQLHIVLDRYPTTDIHVALNPAPKVFRAAKGEKGEVSFPCQQDYMAIWLHGYLWVPDLLWWRSEEEKWPMTNDKLMSNNIGENPSIELFVYGNSGTCSCLIIASYIFTEFIVPCLLCMPPVSVEVCRLSDCQVIASVSHVDRPTG